MSFQQYYQQFKVLNYIRKTFTNTFTKTEKDQVKECLEAEKKAKTCSQCYEERYHILLYIHLIKNPKTVKIQGHILNFDNIKESLCTCKSVHSSQGQFTPYERRSHNVNK